MTHEEQRLWLIKQLQKDDSQLSDYKIPYNEQGQKNLLRGLMNIWMPKELDEEFLKIQDEYLKEENRKSGNNEELLASCYRSCLKLAEELEKSL